MIVKGHDKYYTIEHDNRNGMLPQRFTTLEDARQVKIAIDVEREWGWHNTRYIIIEHDVETIYVDGQFKKSTHIEQIVEEE